jgi:hypothetical protein
LNKVVAFVGAAFYNLPAWTGNAKEFGFSGFLRRNGSRGICHLNGDMEEQRS